MDSSVLLDAAVVTRCRRRVHLDHDPAAAALPRAAPDPAVEQRIADAATHRRTVADMLTGYLRAQWVELPDSMTAAQRVAATRSLLAARVPFVWGALLPVDVTAGRRGGVELLVRHGDGYLPVIVVRHKVTDPGCGARTSPLTRPTLTAAASDPRRKPRPNSRDQFRLAHAVRMLQAAGLAASGPAVGGVVGQDADVVLWYDLEAPNWPDGRSALGEYDLRFVDRLAIARSATNGYEPLAQPSRVTECRSCPWWPTCGTELRAARDVSMVLRGEDAEILRGAGIRTVDELAALDPDGAPPAMLAGVSFRDAVALARAWQRGLPLIRQHQVIEVPRADVELDIDMESFADAGAYLWGCLLTGADIGLPHGYRAFATWDPLPTTDEARSFAAFWGWLTEVRERAACRGLSFRAYCYNEQAENRWMLSSAERFAGVRGVPEVTEVRRFIGSAQWVDLFGVVISEFLCAHGKGLKTVAPVAGFAWRDPQASGENSMRWYRDAVGLDGSAPDPSQRTRLLTYNADDVQATYTLREWMSSERVGEVPRADDLMPMPVGARQRPS